MIDYSKLSKLNQTQVSKGTSPAIQSAALAIKPSLQLKKDVKSLNYEAAKRVIDQAKSQSSDATDSNINNKPDADKPWKIMIGVGVGIAIVTAIGYFALKE